VPSDLFTDIKAEVAQNAEQLPRFGSLADTGGQQGGELVLFLKQDSRLDASPSEAAKREKELERLQKLEADDKEAKIKEAEEIAKQERELAELDAKIEETRERLGTRTEKTDDRLNALFAMARKKKEQQTRLDELKKKRQEEEERRLAEIVQLRETRRIELISALEEDIRKYQEIASSPSGKDMKEDAWKSLVSKYPEAAKDLETGDTNRLLSNVKWANAERTFTNSIGIKFVLIPPGAFMMGSPTDEPGREDNEKQHSVTISKGYYMQATEVTQGQWRAIMGDSPSYFKDCGDDCPVEKVSWYDAQEFIKKLNDKEGTDKHRLPTEAEWEYACRAGSTTAFANGGITEKECGCDPNLDAIGWYCGNSEAQPHPVAQKKPNAWGLYDMHGNVWEWCQDWYGDYLLGNVTDPKGPLSGKHRVFRSGGWGINAEGCRSAYRLRNKPGNRYHFGGFRVTMDFD